MNSFAKTGYWTSMIKALGTACCHIIVILAVIAGASPADSLNVRMISRYDIPSATWNVTLGGQYAYVAADSTGLRIFDVSNPYFPVEIGKCNTPGLTEHVSLSGLNVYVSDNESGLQIIDVSNPHRPFLVSSYDTPGWSINSAAKDSLIVVSDVDAGLRIVNVTNPNFPVEIGSYVRPGWAWWNVVSGCYAYVAWGMYGLRVVDISDPANPKEVGHYAPAGGDANGLSISGHYVFLADGYEGLYIIDISAPATPILRGHYPVMNFVVNVVIAGNLAYLVELTSPSGSMLEVLNVSNPDHPELIGRYSISCDTWGLAVGGNYIFTATSEGLKIFEYYGPSGVSNYENRPDAAESRTAELRCLPNPFSNNITIEYQLNRFLPVRVDIYNLAGQHVVRLCTEATGPGRQKLAWCGKDSNGRAVPAGIYFIRLATDNGCQVAKIVKLR